jgi:hypothetical protein
MRAVTSVAGTRRLIFESPSASPNYRSCSLTRHTIAMDRAPTKPTHRDGRREWDSHNGAARSLTKPSRDSVRTIIPRSAGGRRTVCSSRAPDYILSSAFVRYALFGSRDIAPDLIAARSSQPSTVPFLPHNLFPYEATSRHYPRESAF